MAKKTTHRKPIKVLKKKVLKAKKPKKDEVLSVDEIVFKPQEHFLVPKHEVLGQEQVEQLFISYKVSPQNLPVIFISDPALQGLDVKMGDIIRVTRKSATAGTALFYRRVAYE